MNIYISKIMKIFTFMLFVSMIFINNSYAQKASAELITKIDPAALASGENVEDGVRQVLWHQNKLFITNLWSGLQIVDVRDYRNPKVIGRYYNDDKAHNTFIENNYAYISDELDGVKIVDISDPTKPYKVCHIQTEESAYWVSAVFPYVYVAEAERGIVLYDVTDFSNPVQVSLFDTPGWAWYVIVKNDIAYVGDKNGGLQIIDFSDKTTPKRIGQLTNLTFVKTVFLDGDYAYLANGPNGMAIVNIANPQFPKVVGEVETEGFVFDVYKAGNNVFIATEKKQEVVILNITDVKNPERAGTYEADGKIYGVAKQDVYLFAAADNNLSILRYNNQPILADIADQTVDENAMLSVYPEATELDGDPFFFEISNLPNGAAYDSLTGVITWTPSYEQSGLYKDIIVKVIENTESRLSDSKSFAITVNHINRLPEMATIEDYEIEENKLFYIDVPEGSDPDTEDQGKLVYSAENIPEGSEFDAENRLFKWTPTYEQSGVYTVDFVINDGAGGSDRDASTITVLHVDRKPEIAEIQDQNINENQHLVFNITGTDPDKEDQNAISFAAENLPEGANFNSSTLEFSWTPTFDQSGVYENIMFIMTAGALKDSTSFAINVAHVNRQPHLDPIAEQTVDEQKLLTVKISGHDDDIEDKGKLKFSASNLPQGATFNPDSLLFSWTPSYEQSGTYDNVTFTITDPAGLSDSKILKINVNHINRAPVLDEIVQHTVAENNQLVFDVTGSDADKEDQDKLLFTAQDLPEGAVFENQNFSWTPTYDQSGEYTITFTLTDGRLSDTKSTTITVTHVNRPPTIEPVEEKTVDENKLLTFTITGGDPDTEDTDKWTLSVANLPEGAEFNAETATFTWTPTYEQSGIYEVTFTNTDPAGLTATEIVKITVNHINRTPVFEALAAQTVDENNTLSYEVPAGSDPDKEDQQSITYAAQNLPEGAQFDGSSRILSWTPTFEQSGTYTVTITCSDGKINVDQPVTITVNHINRPPIIETIPPQTVDENSALNYTVKATDPDKEDEGKTQLVAENLPEGATFDTATGAFTWTPTYEQSGTYSTNFTITDPAGLSDSKTMEITVNHVNRSPQLGSLTAQTVNENEPLTYTIPEGSDPDEEDAGKLTYSAQNLPAGATFDPPSRVFTWTPNFAQAGNYQITFVCSDGALNAEQTLNVTVNNINREPSLEAIGDKTGNENETIRFSVIATDPDLEDENNLKYTATNLPSGAELDENSGQFSWTPSFDQAGQYDNITVTVSDQEGLTVNQSFSVSIENVNRKPEIEGGGSITVQAGETAELSFSANDPDGDEVTLNASDLPEGATFDSNSGRFSWQTPADESGTFNFTVTASDGSDSVEQSASVTVNVPPPPPQPQQEQQQQN